MNYYLLLLLPFVGAFNFRKLFATSLLATGLAFNPNQIANANPNMIPSIHNQGEFIKTSVVTERNNIYLYGAISPESCEQLKNQLNSMDYNGRLFKISYNSDPPPINLHIQSGGGSLLNALYIVDLIETLDTPVNTYIDGYSASAASLIGVVGDKRYMTKNSMIMIHQLSSGKEGKYQELDDDQQNMQQFMNKIKAVYLRKTTIPYIQLSEILNHDLWLDATTCKKLGLVDEIIE
tara:strand:+ start:1289 stop:1993 length:705 start_codon:yes stop_codon:yes gene_type:complete